MNPTIRKYRDLIEGERIEEGDEYLHASGSWLPTGCCGDTYSLKSNNQFERHLPHRRPVTSFNRKSNYGSPPTKLIERQQNFREALSKLNNKSIMPTPSHSYRILNDNKTKPVRCIVLIDGKVYVEGVTKAIAREIVAGHMMMTNPDLGSHQALTREFISSSGI
jgi:hypothetical protein